jgi:hypothetical protein
MAIPLTVKDYDNTASHITQIRHANKRDDSHHRAFPEAEDP